MDFKEAIESLNVKNIELKVKTNEGRFSYNTSGELGFNVDDNLTIIDNEFDVKGKLIEINSKEINDKSEFYNFSEKLFPKNKLVINTNRGQYAYLTSKEPDISASIAKTSNLKKGLDLEGGTRVLLLIKGEDVNNKAVNNLIEVLSNRLDVYGLSDLRIRQSKDTEGNNLVNIEIAGANRDEVKDLIGKQGRFEAKIGKEIVFIGEKKDIPFVCKGDGSCSGVSSCSEVSDGVWQCRFEFQIRLSDEAAKRQGITTSKLDINGSEGGDYLSETLDLYLDDKEIDSLRIAADLKGNEKATSILISGPGVGNTQDAAISDAMSKMSKLQVIMMTGSLPFDIEIIKLDTISPLLGRNFLKNIFFVGLFAFLSVTVVVFLRYRNIKILLPMMMTSVCELVITLGFAALIQWNLDIVSIAGLIAAIGTGVNDNIIFIDEVLTGQKERNWKDKVKRAFFIIISAYFTIIVAMLPLWNAGAGLVRGFAVTTIVGVSVGILITRPAFASIAKLILEK